ncbi:hypothetical protein KUH32_08155 [Thalassococcus sp. CAU 1522]|uniref:Lipoprotein n=1 Tax=Thalassococcus arenae TaxID=2851652 RepID=A0ABS6N6W0_9RHOB|nr:hypothetical protein [Thalassococcus arenae]MBV2359744.1 hypothetical protein [Thalassococcus arenae]
MRVPAVFCALLLMSCDAAGPGFRGADKVVREVDGSRFTLRFRGNLVEAIRTSPEFLPRFPDVARKAAIAADTATGCKTAWVVGDPAMMTIGQSCNGEKAPPKPKRRKSYTCDLFDVRYSPALDSGAGTLNCTLD